MSAGFASELASIEGELKAKQTTKPQRFEQNGEPNLKNLNRDVPIGNGPRHTELTIEPWLGGNTHGENTVGMSFKGDKRDSGDPLHNPSCQALEWFGSPMGSGGSTSWDCSKMQIGRFVFHIV